MLAIKSVVKKLQEIILKVKQIKGNPIMMSNEIRAIRVLSLMAIEIYRE